MWNFPDCVFVLTARSESGDDYVWVFKDKPSDSYREEVVKRDLGDEAEYISSWDIVVCEVEG